MRQVGRLLNLKFILLILKKHVIVSYLGTIKLKTYFMCVKNKKKCSWMIFFSEVWFCAVKK